jgi:hypothetical protein
MLRLARAAARPCLSYILHDPDVKKAWGHLRRYALYHMSFDDDDMSLFERETARVAARQELLSYAELAEQVGAGFPTSGPTLPAYCQ